MRGACYAALDISLDKAFCKGILQIVWNYSENEVEGGGIRNTRKRVA